MPKLMTVTALTLLLVTGYVLQEGSFKVPQTTIKETPQVKAPASKPPEASETDMTKTIALKVLPTVAELKEQLIGSNYDQVTSILGTPAVKGLPINGTKRWVYMSRSKLASDQPQAARHSRNHGSFNYGVDILFRGSRCYEVRFGQSGGKN